MNERIKELLTPKLKEWAGDSDDNFSEELEKFAELIVRECARVYWNIDDGEIHGEYVEALKKHFGVE